MSAASAPQGTTQDGATAQGFAELGLAPRLLTALTAQGMTRPTPIQARAIPAIMAGRDLMGLAQTGTGKTAAFGLPLLHRLLDVTHPPKPRHVRALILAPTRELVNQIADYLTAFTKGTPVKVTVVVGGASINKQAERLARGSDVLVATPGRLIDLLDRGDVTLEACAYLVLDEADHMLDMGFIHSLRKIARFIPVKRQTLMFSATMPADIAEISETYLRNPVKVEVAPPGKPAEGITQGVHFIPMGDKAKLLEDYLKKHPGEQALVFSRTKHGAEKLMKLLAAWGFNAGSIHGNKSQNQRDRTLTDFREGRLMVLVATDVAARGLDIPTVRHVYNYDLPNVPENYVHRIGRTARAGEKGTAVAFCAPAEMPDLAAIEKVLKKPIPVLGGAPWAADMVAASPRPGQKPRQGQPSRGPGKPAAAKPGAKPAAKTGPKPGPKPPAKPPAAKGGAQPPVRPPAGGTRPPRRTGQRHG
jgi:ATP-dependent RNA helicase RhlE